MATVRKLQRLSVDEYLQGEQQAEQRHELVAGEVHAMTGASNLHNLLAGALHAALRAHLRGSGCRVFVSDMKVRIDDDFYYPDLLVSCHPQTTIAYYETEPVVIIEILSPSTEARDRFEKRLAYQRLLSLREYVLVTQDRLRIEVYRRAENGWEVETCTNGDALQLQSIDFRLPVTGVYEDVMNFLG